MECQGIPRLYAAASLKQGSVRRLAPGWWRIPRLYAAASLKPTLQDHKLGV